MRCGTDHIGRVRRQGLTLRIHLYSRCPMVLKIAACQLLLEITSYMRETYKSIPKVKKICPITKYLSYLKASTSFMYL